MICKMCFGSANRKTFLPTEARNFICIGCTFLQCAGKNSDGKRRWWWKKIELVLKVIEIY